MMDKAFLVRLKKWFLKYARTFDCEDDQCRKAVVSKLKHSFGVSRDILLIGKELSLKEKDLILAQTMALLHDIGRFEQYAKYRTFVDKDSVNHAELSVKVIDSNNILESLDPFSRNLLTQAILYHNNLSLPYGETEKCLFFTKLLRDSDKLDICRFFIEDQVEGKNGSGYSFIIELPDSPGVSEGVYSDLSQKKIVNYDHVHNINDYKLLLISWVYDINFYPTFQLIKKRNYLKRIQSSLLGAPFKIDNVYSKVRVYLEKKIYYSKPGA